MEMYLVSVDIGKPGDPQSFRFTQVVVAKDDDDAFQMAIEEIKQREFSIGKTGYTYTNQSVAKLDHELIEEAAELVLGWSRPDV